MLFSPDHIGPFFPCFFSPPDPVHLSCHGQCLSNKQRGTEEPRWRNGGSADLMPSVSWVTRCNCLIQSFGELQTNEAKSPFRASRMLVLSCLELSASSKLLLFWNLPSSFHIFPYPSLPDFGSKFYSAALTSQVTALQLTVLHCTTSWAIVANLGCSPMDPGRLDSPLFHVVSVPHHTMPPIHCQMSCCLKGTWYTKPSSLIMLHIPYQKKWFVGVGVHSTKTLDPKHKLPQKLKPHRYCWWFKLWPTTCVFKACK